MSRLAKLRSDLIAVPTEIDGNQVVNVKDPITGNYFRLREPEYWLISQLDGETEYDQIATRFKEKFGLEIDGAAVQQFVSVLEKQLFLEDGRAEQAISRKSYGSETKPSLVSRMLFIKLKAFNPTSFLDSFMKFYRPFHNWVSAVILIGVILFGIGVMAANSQYFAVTLGEVFRLESIVTIVLSFFILITLHEFAHAVVCRYFGGEVRSMGFLLLYFQPCFYTDLSDAWLFKKKSHRLAVTWAGPFFQLVFATFFVLLWRVTVPYSFIGELARLTAIVSWITLLFNFNPLIKLDGYYLLSDWLDIPNLRAKSFAYFGNIFKRYLLGWPIEPVKAEPKQKRIYLVYAISALIYSAGLLGYVFYLVATFLFDKLGPSGLVLLAIILLFTLRSGIAAFGHGLIRHIKFMAELTKRPVRLTVYIIVAIVLCIVLFAIPFPHRVSGEITVRPIEEFELTLNEYGSLESRFRKGGANPETKVTFLQTSNSEMDVLDLLPLVQDGQAVKPGDTLAILSSSQVTREIMAESSELNRLESQLALLKAPPKKEQIREAEGEVQKARTNLEKLERDLTRIQALHAQGGIADNDLEELQASVDLARAELNNKQSRLDLLNSPPRPEEEAVLEAEIEKQQAKVRFLQQRKAAQQITTPIFGTTSAGRDNKDLLTIINHTPVEVLIPVSDFDFKLVDVGQDVQVMVRSYPGTVYIGKVVHIPKTAESVNGEGMYIISATVANEDHALSDGMTGYAKIEIGSISLFNLILRKIASLVRVEFWSWW